MSHQFFTDAEEQAAWQDLAQGSEQALDFFYHRYVADIQKYIVYEYLEKTWKNNERRYPTLRKHAKYFAQQVCVETFYELRRQAGKSLSEPVSVWVYKLVDDAADKAVWAMYKKGQLLNINYFYNKYFPSILNRIRKKINNDEAAQEDTCQDVFRRFYNGLDKFKWNAGLSTWLYQITSTAIIDYYRRQKHQDKFVPLPEDGDTEDEELSKLLDKASNTPKDNFSPEAEQIRDRLVAKFRYWQALLPNDDLSDLSLEELEKLECYFRCLECFAQGSKLSEDCILVIIGYLRGIDDEEIAKLLSKSPKALAEFRSSKCYKKLRETPLKACLETCAERELVYQR